MRVHVVPGARKSALVLEGKILKARVAAPPVDGKANAALCALLASAAGVRTSKVTVVRGETSREKTVEIEGGSAEKLRAALGAR